jgi:signal transduction histidine kinase
VTSRRYRLTTTTVAFVCTASALVQYLAVPTALAVSAAWLRQGVALLGASFAFSAMLFFFGDSRAAVAVLLTLRFVSLGILVIPEAARFGVIGPIYVSCILDLIYYPHVPLNRVLGGAGVLSILGLRQPLVAWGFNVPRPSLADLVALCVVGCIVALLADRHRFWAERGGQQSGQIKHLDEGILRLIRANTGFQEYADTVKEKAAQEERYRITREIHDAVGYTLVNIMMMMEDAALVSAEAPPVRELCVRSREQAQSALNQTRRALHLLRESRAEEPKSTEEIRKIALAFESATGVSVTVEYGNIPTSMDATVAACVFPLLQEGMANALRHGKATRIQVLFWRTESELIVNLHDNGTGSVHIEEGIGLQGMRERVAALGGSFAASGREDGFQITARIPYSARQGQG